MYIYIPAYFIALLVISILLKMKIINMLTKQQRLIVATKVIHQQ